MIIGDTMDKMNIVDFGLPRMSSDYKRSFFYQLDRQLKMIHQNGGIVQNFSPFSIFVDEETRTPSFQAVYPASRYYFDEEDQKQARVNDIRMISTLAFCMYLAGEEPEYSLGNGLLQFDVLKNNMDFTCTYFPEEDLDYYKQVFSDGVEEPIYYSDYIDQKMNSMNTRGNSISLSKSTEAGRALSPKNGEAAYVNYVLTFSIVGTLVMLGAFFLFYILS